MRVRASALVSPVTTLLLVGLLLGACSQPEGDPQGLDSRPPTPQPQTRTATPTEPSSAADPTEEPAEEEETRGVRRPRVVGTVARGLAAPWGIAFLPDGSALVGERDRARLLALDTGSRPRVVGRVAAASPQGEAGLLGLAVSPTFAQDGLVYAYVSTVRDNRVVRFTYDGERIGRARPVLTGIPNGFIHDGGRLLFDEDGMLLVSTGETGVERLAQDRSSLGGKILRITPEGDPAPGNPVPGSPVWTMGHRNVQGLALDGDDRLWASEFGDSTWDELNRIEEGRNYGWPVVEGRGGGRQYRDPFVQWRTAENSPSGLAHLDGSLWMASLRGERLWEVGVRDDGSVGRPDDWFVGSYGRLRTVVVAPNGNLWVTTSNRDGRGDPAAGDDRILEVAVPG